MKDTKTLKDYMRPNVRQSLGSLPTYHSNCIAATQVRSSGGKIIVEGIARPGKTARDRARREMRA